MRVLIRPKVYRGKSGFIVSWNDPAKVGRQRIFVTSRHTAESLKVAAKQGISAEVMRMLYGQSNP